MFEDLTKRQKQILDYIRNEIRSKGYPPSVREIGEAVGLNSSSTVHGHLEKLESKGYIRRDPTKPRAIELLDGLTLVPKVVNVPLVGHVAAGQPILAEENIEDYYPLPASLFNEENAFMLRVSGESMIEAGIFDGDYVIIRPQNVAINGDIVVALLDDSATVKTFYRENNYIRLQPENPYMEPIISNNVQILGKVIGVFRKIV